MWKVGHCETPRREGRREKGCKTNAVNGGGWTALHHALKSLRFDIVKYLVEQGCSITATNNRGQSSLDVARSEEIALFLRYAMECTSQGFSAEQRATNILVGSGTAGKTALVQRLRYQSYSHEGLVMTDGVDISHFRIGQVKMLALDFAGQKEYAHTHAIFFKNTAIYLAVYMPRDGAHFSELENFLQMV